MFGLGLPEVTLIAVAALVVFGPKKLPELARSLGRSIQEFKKGAKELEDNVRREIDTTDEGR